MTVLSNPKKQNMPPGAVNLMEKQPSRCASISPHAGWFTQARLGMFVHYGLYSVLGRGEWSMFFDKIPKDEYNLLANEFTAEKFDATEVISLAKRAGAGYVVMGARHHEGFCLWDTKTTDFNSVHTAAQRDLIREYVDACRRGGLRVGIYYSVMSWQWPAIIKGPIADPEGWKAMVEETHQQVRELLTGYGKIDLLWYDGCVVPGLGAAEVRAKYWRSRELNAMVRRLQPAILINDRAALPEDISTPEQNLTPPPPGRLWECCQTMGEYWGWRSDDTDLKSAKELIEQLVFCARYGGNFLLNVGLKGDGTIPEEQVCRMEAIGRWMQIHGESVRGGERTPYTEALHAIGSATAHGKKLYFHIPQWPKESARIAGINVPIESALLMGDGKELGVKQFSDGTATLVGLPESEPIRDVKVVALTLSQAPVPKAPPSLLVERDTGRHAPSEAPVCTVIKPEMKRIQRFSFVAPTTGRYQLDLSIIAERATSIYGTLDGKSLPQPFLIECGNYPNSIRFGDFVLSEGNHELILRGNGALFMLNLWRLQPVWKAYGPENWRTIGPFPTAFSPQGNEDQVREALQTPYAPEIRFESDNSYPGVAGTLVRWKTHPPESESVSLAQLCGGKFSGVCYARTILVSSEARFLDVLLACDWWANLFVNGELVQSQRDASKFAQDGAWFCGWKPIPARIQLKQGENIILVKCHPGSNDNWFTFFVNASPDICIRP